MGLECIAKMQPFWRVLRHSERSRNGFRVHREDATISTDRITWFCSVAMGLECIAKMQHAGQFARVRRAWSQWV